MAQTKFAQASRLSQTPVDQHSGSYQRSREAYRQAQAAYARTQELWERCQAAMAAAQSLREGRSEPGTRRDLLQHSHYARLLARLETLPVIEQAKGVIMAQSGCSPDQAFDKLRQASQRLNIPIRDLAPRIIATAAVPVRHRAARAKAGPARAKAG